MYYLIKNLELSSSHFLKLNYESKCSSMHGHNWIIIVYCKNDKLNENGMIVDFAEIKKIVMTLDHQCINDYIKQPTAENIAEYLCKNIPFCYKIKVQESKNNTVLYEKI